MTERLSVSDIEKMIGDGEVSLAIDIMAGLCNCLSAIKSNKKRFLYRRIMFDLETGFNRIKEEYTAIIRSGVLERYKQKRIFELYEAKLQQIQELGGLN